MIPDGDARPQAGSPARRALTATLLYAAFSGLWILFSDRLVSVQVQDPAQLALINTLKGWLYVVVSSAFIYALLKRWLGQPNSGQRPAVSRRSLLLAFAVTGLAIVGLTWLLIHERLQNTRLGAGQQLLAIASSKAEQLGAWHQERLRDARFLAEGNLDTLWRTWQRDGDERARAEALNHLRQAVVRGGFRRAALVTADHTPHWLDWNEGPIDDAVLRAAIDRVLRRGEAQSVGPWLDTGQRTRLAFVAPLGVGSPQAGAVVLQIDPPPEIHPTLASWPLPATTAQSLLFRQEGDEVLYMTPVRGMDGAPMRLRLPVATAAALPAAFLRGDFPPGTAWEGPDHRGTPVLGVVLPVGDTGWWLAAQVDRAELMSPAVIEGLTTALAGVLALLSAGIAVFLYEQRERLKLSAANIEKLEQAQQRLAQSEARYRLLAESGDDVIWLYDLARERFAYISPSIERVFGHPVHEALELPLEALLAPESYAFVRDELPAWLSRWAAGDAPITRRDELVQLHRDGRMIPIEIETTLILDDAGRVVQLKGITRDISARRAAESRILQLSQAMEQSPAVVIITDRHARIEYVNQAFEATTGYPREEVIGRNPKMLRSDKTPRETFETMWHALQAGESWSGEIINRHKNGRDYIQTVTIAPVRNAVGEVTHYLSVQLDITAQRTAEDKAHQLAWFDVLTGLPNRHHLLLDVSGVLASARRLDHHSALFIINIDRFKTLNEAMGHAAGDRLLQRLAKRLIDTVRPGDHLARLGADEFAWLTPVPDGRESDTMEDALRLATSVHEALDPPFKLAGVETPVKVTVSIGIALLPLHEDDTPAEVLRRADTALSRAKDGGGRQTAFFDAAMGEVISQRFVIEQDLRRGLVAGELRLYLQPQVNAAGRMVSAEALLRWQHPQRGLVPPVQFIPVAEGCDLIEPIGDWVLEEVCERLGRLHRQGRRLPVAVNISPRQFHQSTFVPDLLQRLERTGAQPGDLILEITEGVVVRDVEDVVRRMGELTRHGIRFSIDDFGTGYSSLSYLKNLPIHEVKIDRSFVQDAPTQPSDAALVEAILAVATHLRLRVVAEGVETAEQAAFFERHPDVILQGYRYGRPAPADEVIARALAESGQG